MTKLMPRLLLILGFLSLSAQAGGIFRDFRPIAGPGQPFQPSNFDSRGMREINSPKPLPQATLQRHLQAMFDKWNSPQMQEILAEGFYDRDRLLNSMNQVVPRDAKVRLLAMQDVQLLRQFEQPAEAPGDKVKRISLVSATLATQLEFNSPSAGYVRLPGRNEFLLEVTETLRRATPLQP